jgi:nitroreductase
MDVFQAIQERREITRYKDKPIPDDILKKIEDAGVLAPTGNNLPSKNFIVIQNRKTLDQLSETTPFVPWLKEAPAAIAVIGKPEVSKYWLQDTSIASAFIWLEAVEMGLGSAFGAVFNMEDETESRERESYARNILNIPAAYRVTAILGLGYPADTPKPKKHIPRDQIVFYEKYKTK